LCHAFDGADVVYHLAGIISLSMDEWPAVEAVNIIGTRNVAEACLRCGVRRLIHFSSIHAITREPMGTPVDESRPLIESQSYPPYDRSKAAGEKEILKGIERGLDAIILRPTAIIGPHDYQPSHFGWALLAIANGKLLALVAGGFDWVDVRDVVAGAMRAEERAPAGAKYILSDHWVSLPQVAELIQEITGVPAPSFVCPTWLAQLGAPIVSTFDRLAGRRPLYTSVSIRALGNNQQISHEKASRELDYHPRPFRETIIDTLRWFEKRGTACPPTEANITEMFNYSR
jgi:dihydroflavonol-4-reductase